MKKPINKEKILHIPIEEKWFNMILQGIKLEEYREVKDYWITRLCDIVKGVDIEYVAYSLLGGEDSMDSLNTHPLLYKYKKFDYILFKNGYRTNAPEIKIQFKGVEVKMGNTEWGAPHYPVFAISLGKIVETKNIKNEV